MPHQSFTAPLRNQLPEIRLTPIVHLQTGETVTLIAETDKRFEERAVFGRAALDAERADAASQTPAAWLASLVERVARQAHVSTTERPIIVSTPLAALVHPDTATACDAAIKRTHLCPQEICLEICDAALSLPSTQTQAGIEALRRCGFRVSIDSTRSWQTAMSTSLRLLLDNIRIDARRLEAEAELEDRVEAASAAGMAVIAEHAPWRDGDYLASLGIEYALRPRVDA